MYHNPTQMDSYNKFPGRTAQGISELMQELLLPTGRKREI